MTMGVALIEEDARVAGAVPDPITDEFDWLYMRSYLSRVIASGEQSDPLEWMIDIRARRKMNERTVLCFIFEAGTGNVGVLELSANLRTLVLLP